MNTASTGDTMHVAGITMTVAPAGKSIKGTARVAVVNQNGAPVVNAQVVGDWSFNGAVIQTGVSAIAELDGLAVLTSAPIKGSSGTFTFRVTNVVLDGTVYDPAANVETERSVTYP